jgi:16S rRNA (guanine527-N7)-methyltransferase
MKKKFVNAILKNQKAFGLNLVDSQIEKVAEYYEIVKKNNALLHLVAPCSDEEFAVRHILESLTLLEFLPERAKFADVGTGAGLPSIPCLLVREDLEAVLIESKLKKSVFLQEVAEKCSFKNRINIINRQFEEVSKLAVTYITCRALDKFTQKLPKILRWSKGANLLFFGGNSLREELIKNCVEFTEKLMPLSEQRFLFISQKTTHHL